MTWPAPTVTLCDRCGTPVSWQHLGDLPPAKQRVVDAAGMDGRLFCPAGKFHEIDGWDSLSLRD